MQMRLDNATLSRASRGVTNLLCSLLFGLFVGASIEVLDTMDRIEAAQIAAAKREAQARAILAHTSGFDHWSERTCLTNIAYHEARGESKDTRHALMIAILQMRDDRSWPGPRSICARAEVKGEFTDLVHPRVTRLTDPVWRAIYLEAWDIYAGIWRTVFPEDGAGCVRRFMISDQYLASLSLEARERLKITPEARGIKWMKAHFEPVMTIGKKTFYQPKGGCRNPLPTA